MTFSIAFLTNHQTNMSLVKNGLVTVMLYIRR